jgi:hypothetical protein
MAVFLMMGSGSTADAQMGGGCCGGAGFNTTHFIDSAACGQCHNGLRDPAGNDVSIETDWDSTMMANSARDPLWRAKVATELRRTPGLSAEINNKCTRCHAPMANFEAAYDGAPIELFGNGFLNPQNAYHKLALDGVGCMLCHQIQDSPALGTLAGFSGQFTIGTYSNKVDRPAFGQFLNPLVHPMQMSVKYTPTYSAHISESKTCATCHNLKTPFVDSQGNVVPDTPEEEFPEQMVYSEWENSVYGRPGPEFQSCQSCHLPTVDGAMRIASRPMRNVPLRNGFAKHLLVGGNTMMLDIFAKNRSALGVTGNNFATVIQRTREMLASAAELQIVSASRVSGELTVQLRVINHSGHKLPSGYPSRRAYLHFVVRDANGATVFESGRLNADGSIVGVDSDTDLSTYEPHYQEIAQADQVQVYEPIMADTDGNVTYTLLRAAAYLKDNRLTPEGFNKFVVPTDVQVMGAALTDADFNDGSDTITYRVPVAADGSLTVLAELRFQPLAYGFAQDLFQDADNPYVNAFRSLFQTANIRSETIASATRVVN